MLLCTYVEVNQIKKKKTKQNKINMKEKKQF